MSIVGLVPLRFPMCTKEIKEPQSKRELFLAGANEGVRGRGGGGHHPLLTPPTMRRTPTTGEPSVFDRAPNDESDNDARYGQHDHQDADLLTGAPLEYKSSNTAGLVGQGL